MNISYVDNNGAPVSMQYEHHQLICKTLAKCYIHNKPTYSTIIVPVISTIIVLCISALFMICSVKCDKSCNVEKSSTQIVPTEPISVVAEETSEVSSVQYFKPEALSPELFDVVVSECNSTGLPVNVALAIMKTETQTFATNSTNHNNNGSYDCGIMQINSTNINSFAKIYKCPEFASDPYNPVSNITVGIRHLASMWNVYINKYNQDEIKALLATAGGYNRGVSNQNKYNNIYEYNARAYAHYINLCNNQDVNINYATEIPSIKLHLKNNITL